VRGLTKRSGSLVTANSIDLDVFPCRLHSIIGPNGAGKTTFFNVLTGLLPTHGGTVVFAGQDIMRLPLHLRIRLGSIRSFQILSVFPKLTAFENVRVAVQAQHRRLAVLANAYALAAVNDRTWFLLAAAGLEERAAAPCETLSHGEQRLLELASSLATDARLLLLDERLAGLAKADREVVSALTRKPTPTQAVLLVEHDIDRVLALSGRITVLHQGRLIADGKPAQVAENPEAIAAYLRRARLRAASRPAPRRRLAHGRPLLAIAKGSAPTMAEAASSTTSISPCMRPRSSPSSVAMVQVRQYSFVPSQASPKSSPTVFASTGRTLRASGHTLSTVLASRWFRRAQIASLRSRENRNKPSPRLAFPRQRVPALRERQLRRDLPARSAASHLHVDLPHGAGNDQRS
jgi:ABC-type branched-subunit amino acid transport system ATPase component